jgi:hypothetical protein
MAERRTLLYGSQGPDVEQLQMYLNKFIEPRPDIGPDGQFGKIAKSTVVKLQNQCNQRLVSRKVVGFDLGPDGIVGPNTWKVIDWLVQDDQRGRDRAPGFATLVRNGGRIVPHFYQGDSRWGSNMLRSKTIASKGCTM